MGWSFGAYLSYALVWAAGALYLVWRWSAGLTDAGRPGMSLKTLSFYRATLGAWLLSGVPVSSIVPGMQMGFAAYFTAEDAGIAPPVGSLSRVVQLYWLLGLAAFALSGVLVLAFRWVAALGQRRIRNRTA